MNENNNVKSQFFENAEHFRSLVHNVDGYLYTVLYEKGEPIASYHSPRCEEITSYKPEDYENDPGLWIKMVAEEDREYIYRFFNSRKNKTEQTYIEHRIIRKNGEKRWVSNRFTEQVDENGLLTRRDGFILDITERKQTELALREQNVFLQHLIDAIPNPVFFKDVNGLFRGCNNMFEEYVGRKREDIVGGYTRDIMTAELASLHEEMDKKIYETGEMQVYESDFLHSNGSNRKLVYYKAPYLTAQNTIGGIVGVMIDATRLKAAEETLQETYTKLKEMESIINKSPAIVFLRKATERLTVEFVSDNIKQFGYSAQDFENGQLQFFDIVFPGDRARVREEMERCATKNIMEFTQEYRIVMNDGKLVWIDDHSSLRYDRWGKLTHYLGIVIDISKRKQALELFRESIERYKTLAENSYDLISEIDAEGKFLYISPNYFSTLGYGSEELLSKSIFEYIHPDDMTVVKQEMRKLTGQINHRMRHKNGEWLWFESAGKQYITVEGSKRGVIVSRDISIRKKLQQQIIRTEKLVAVGEMSAMIAHEFRNSLTSIKMILQLQNESKRLLKTEKRSLVVALDSILHMEDVIKQLLNFAQPAALMFKKDSINQILLDCLQFVEMQAHRKAVKISSRFDLSLPELMLHAPSLREGILNLLINATQSFDMQKIKIQRRIIISTEKIVLEEQLTDSELNVENEYFKMRSNITSNQEISLEQGTECALIKIADNGCGIEESYLKHIFEPFFTSKEKGTGLGLSIVKRTINAHGGVIRVISKAAKGTTFKIYLPIAGVLGGSPV